MQDIINLLYECKEKKVAGEEVVREVANVFFEELRRMDFEEFSRCFSSAAIEPKTKKYVIEIKFNV